MKTFNRVSAFVLAATILLVGGSLVIGAVLLPGPYSVTTFNGEQFSFSALATTDKLLYCIAGLALALAGILTLALEILGPPTPQQLPLTAVDVTDASIERRGVEARLEAVLTKIPNITQAQPHVDFEPAGVSVDVSIVVDAEASLPPLCTEARATIERTLEHGLGLLPGAIRMRVRLARHHTDKNSAAVPA